MLPYLTEVWERFLDEVLAEPQDGRDAAHHLFRPVRPGQERTKELAQALETIQAFKAKSRRSSGSTGRRRPRWRTP